LIAKKILLIFAVLATSASSLLFDIKAKENYENLDRIVAIVEKDIITKKEFDLEVIQIIQQYKKMNVPTPSQESLDKIVIDKIIEKKLVQQYAELKGIKIGAEYLDQTINNIAENNNLTTQELQKSIESEGMSFSYFQEKN
jgi:peptidyl-prolyl cis-trans isomerase SurA